MYCIPFISDPCLSQTGRCRKHNSVDCMPQGLGQPIAMTLTSDPSNCPRCHKAQQEAARRLSVLDSADSEQDEGEEANEEEGDGRKGSDGTGDLEKEEDGEEGGQLALCSDMWQEVRIKLRGIVESKYFNRGIMIAILVNTISMGIEHHEQVTKLMASKLSQQSDSVQLKIGGNGLACCGWELRDSGADRS